MTKPSLLADAVEHYVAQVATKETDIQQTTPKKKQKSSLTSACNSVRAAVRIW
jgi:hypothetical protein